VSGETRDSRGDRAGWGPVRRESATERARRMLVQIAVGPSRITVLTAIGSVVVFLGALLVGYLTRR
jgi:hypothetical protein